MRKRLSDEGSSVQVGTLKVQTKTRQNSMQSMPCPIVGVVACMQNQNANNPTQDLVLAAAVSTDHTYLERVNI